MGTTPKYALPFPEEADDADVPVDMSELATAVDGMMLGRTLVDAKGDLLAADAADSVVRVPVGADGYVLAADSPSAAGVKWVQLAGAYVAVAAVGQPNGVAALDASGKVPAAQLPPGPTALLYDAKGDILVASANDTPVRLPAGADGQVLQVDSAQALGVKWGPPVAGGAGIPPSTVDAKGDLIAATADDTVGRLAVGTVGQMLSADPTQPTGLKWIAPSAAAAGVLLGVQVIAATGVYTPTPGTTRVYVEAVGGGGSSGGIPATAANAAAGGGGGGGAYAAKFLGAGFAGVTCTIGAGGAAGGAGAVGNAGGDTSFGVLVVAKGGQGGGIAVANAGGADGGAGGSAAASTGDFKSDGGRGGDSSRQQTDFSANGGGGSAFGAPQLTRFATGEFLAAVAGTLYGGGSVGPAASGQTLAAQPGAAGGSGVIRIWEYA